MSQQTTKFITNSAITNAKIANSTIDLTAKVTGALPVANGGTGQTSAANSFGALSPLTTKGDLLSYDTANARLPVGTNGQFLKADSGQSTGLIWSTSSNPNLAITSKTTTYSATTSDDIILCSGSAFTVTLPSVSGNSGKVLRLRKTDSSLSNIITISGTGLSTTLNTVNEEVMVTNDGSNWFIMSRYIDQSEFNYTPGSQGFGTLASNNSYWSRRGSKMYLRIRIGVGTVTATEARIDLPSGATTASTTYLPATSTPQFVGTYGRLSSTTNKGGAILAEAAKTYLVFGGVDWMSSNSMSFSTKVNGSSVCGNSEGFMFTAEVPIEGWNG